VIGHYKEVHMFKPANTDPETGRHAYLPAQNGWDVEEGALAEDVFNELLAMSKLPVDIDIRRRGIHTAAVSYRGLAEFKEDCAELPLGTDRGVRIEVNGIEPIVLSEKEFVCAKISPGAVEAVFRHLEVAVSRVGLGAWRAVGPPR
jgi:hypothetical protein